MTSARGDISRTTAQPPTALPLTALPPTAEAPTLDPALADLLRAEFPALIDDVIEELLRTIPQVAKILHRHFEPEAAEPGDERAGRILFLAYVTSARVSRSARTNLCRSLGRNAYLQGLDRDSLQAAFRIGTQIAWRRLAGIGRRGRASAEQLHLLTETLFACADDVCAHLLTGYAELADRDADSLEARRQRLLDALLAGPVAGPVAELARAAGWRPPRTVALIALDQSRHADRGRPLALDPDVLADLERPDPCLLVPDPEGPGRRDMFRRSLLGVRFAIGPTVPLRQAHVSLRMARHALSLMRRGYLPETGEIRCADHLPALLMLSDEDVARQLVGRRMAALDRLRPQQRETLGETLLAWLTTGGSYPEVAARLSVHPQTVRYRMRRLEELFGRRLQDPEWRYEMILALQADRMISRAAAKADAETGEQGPHPAL